MTSCDMYKRNRNEVPKSVLTKHKTSIHPNRKILLFRQRNPKKNHRGKFFDKEKGGNTPITCRPTL